MRRLYTLDYELFVKLVIGFMLATVIGTLLHEAGHWSVISALGGEASIRYGYTRIEKQPGYWRETNDTLAVLKRKYGHQPVIAHDSPEKQYQELLNKRRKLIAFLISLGGPAQTMLTGSFGLLLLMKNRRWWIGKTKLTLSVWLAIFTALFWLRQPGNLAMSLLGTIRRGHLSEGADDESKLSLALHLWQPTILIVTGLTGLSVLAYIIVVIVPANQRVTFLLAGLVGGIAGFWFWLVWAGPVWMP
ncbi:hypothetical protein [Fibrella forsythiae]|uniref:Peptidase M50 domain-containing protein n=1 Tax=Fibrella forsythiae TaxID=2817061 RepID=A0ABS3JB32_9BACT|nr:hypothetical protein [Fibrella forsythiae]MBO0947198.1 hypothetical protein [Fibrella forsythiae]